MPKTVDEEAIAKATSMDLSKPPVKEIPHNEFPRMVYKHPKSPTRTVREVVAGQWTEYVVLTEHAVKVVGDQKELDRAIKDGFVVKPYVVAAIETAE